MITGSTVPWANPPGGAVAYVLPKTVVEHLSDGSLELVEQCNQFGPGTPGDDRWFVRYPTH